MENTQENEEIEVLLEEEEDGVYVEYDITTFPSDYSLGQLYSMWEIGDVYVPDFQRKYVWSIRQASLLIESLLLGLPVPPVFFYVGEDQKSIVIDGQQRITSIAYFFEGYWGDESVQGKRKVFHLTGLSEKSPYHQKRFEDLSSDEQRKLKNNTILRALNVKQIQPQKEYTSIYHIFERLNTGGTPLKPQEIRNCVFRGQIVDDLNDLNENPHWRKIVGKEHLDKHSKDLELILRLFAMSTLNSMEYEKPMKEFLNKAMLTNQKGDTQEWKTFVSRFPQHCEKIIHILGEKPFHLRGPINSAAMEACLGRLLSVKCDEWPDNLSNRYKKLIGDENFIPTTLSATSDVNAIKQRNNVAERYLFGAND